MMLEISLLSHAVLTIKTSIFQVISVMIILKHFWVSSSCKPAQGTGSQSRVIGCRTAYEAELSQTFVLTFGSVSNHDLLQI